MEVLKSQLKNKHIIIDGHAMLFKYTFGFPAVIRDIHGNAIQGAYGFLAVLLKIIREYEPHSICVCFDSESQNSNHEALKEYKANRSEVSSFEPDRNPIAQLDHVYKCLDYLGITRYEVSGVEADDLIGTIARKLNGKDLTALIFSPDSDFLQLVNDNTFLIIRNGNEDVIYTEALVEVKFGVKPKQIVDLKCIVGDKSDNVPGIFGIGGKTAAKLLNQYGDIERLLTVLDELPLVLRNKIQNSTELLVRNKKIIEIKTCVNIDIASDRYTFSDITIRNLFLNLNFFS